MQVQQNYSLKSHNTFHIDVTAAFFAEINSIDELKQILSDDKYRNLSILPLGEGSNILFTQNYDGLVLKIKLKGKKIVSDSEENVLVEVAAGENWHEFVTFTVDNQLEGVENLALIPGTVGAAPVQNIGAYGQSVDTTIRTVNGIKKDTGEPFSLSQEQCRFSYRSSIFKKDFANKVIITSVIFELKKHGALKTDYVSRRESLVEEMKKISSPPFKIKDVYQAVINIRTKKLPDPKTIGTAGSFFKNPIVTKDQAVALQLRHPGLQLYPHDKNHFKVPAGWLLDEAGWRGKKVGHVATAENQALCIVAEPGVTGVEVKKFVEAMQHDFYEKYGISLEPEVNII